MRYIPPDSLLSADPPFCRPSAAVFVFFLADGMASISLNLKTLLPLRPFKSKFSAAAYTRRFRASSEIALTLRPFKSFQLFSTVDFRNFFVTFSLFWRVGASSLCALCGLRRYRLRHSATLYLLSQISCNSHTVERPRWSGAWIENGRKKY